MSQKGFTIMELVIVILIITVLASFLIPAGGRARERARQAKARSDIAALELALTAFQSDFGYYPSKNPSGTTETNNKDIIELTTGFVFSGGSKSASSHADVTSSTWGGPYLDIDASNTNAAGEMQDPWGNAYVFAIDLDGDPGTTPPSNNVYSFDISSNGPDGSAGGGDDVVNY